MGKRKIIFQNCHSKISIYIVFFEPTNMGHSITNPKQYTIFLENTTKCSHDCGGTPPLLIPGKSLKIPQPWVRSPLSLALCFWSCLHRLHRLHRLGRSAFGRRLHLGVRIKMIDSCMKIPTKTAVNLRIFGGAVHGNYLKETATLLFYLGPN